MTRGLFITGTDTGVGKTYVTALIARDLKNHGARVGAYKPVCTGSLYDSAGRVTWPDAEILAEAIGGDAPLDRICPQRFHAPLAPPVAARAEGRSVDARLLREGAQSWQGRVDVLLIEGVGGLLCPLTDRETVADLARELSHPLLIVARCGLGTINHTLLTIDAAERRGMTVAGVVLSESRASQRGPDFDSNAQEIARHTTAPVLGILPHGSTGELLRDGRGFRMEWSTLAATPVTSSAR